MRVYEEVLLSEQECINLIDEWKSILCLDEWTSFIVYTDCNIEESEDNSGFITRAKAVVDFYSKCVTIQMFYPTPDMLEGSLQPWDMEKCIVHELLHIHIGHALCKYGEPDDHTKTSHVMMEQTVESLAHAMISLKRKKHEILEN